MKCFDMDSVSGQLMGATTCTYAEDPARAIYVDEDTASIAISEQADVSEDQPDESDYEEDVLPPIVDDEEEEDQCIWE